MKRTARYCVSAGCLLLLITLFFGFKKAIISAQMPQSCLFSFDSRCSAELKDEINVFAAHLNGQLAGNPSAYCDQLKTQFPLINSLQAELSASGAFVAVQIAKPVCFINDDIIIAAPGIKGTPQSYDNACLENLPHVNCAIEHLPSWSSEKLCSFALLISANLRENYEIILNEYPELNLVDKQQARIKLQVRSDLFNAHEILNRAHAVTALLMERGAFAGKKQRQWTADMRFVKQIILKVN